ncbi:helix-turn-helix domain-containing protein [Paenibacillus medicaginis]|uniref:Helix-turn-helix domain-containing protein n=1 Tax=Paenibacillus medicaginis TaxID=1470560 RepID=A0ABV5C436_9BACL
MSSIGERIREIRKERGLTQVVFGEMMGVSHSHISKIEANKESPSDTLMKLICLDLGVNETWLRTGEGSRSMNVHFRNIDIPDFHETLKRLQFHVQQGHFLDRNPSSTPAKGNSEYQNAIHDLLKHLLNFVETSEQYSSDETRDKEKKQQLYELFSQTRERINRSLDSLYDVLSDVIQSGN